MTDSFFIDPARPQFDAFKALPRDTPINMLNLLRFRDLADYPESHENAGKGMTGAEAYAAYGRDSGAVFTRVGGKVIWRGSMEAVLTGPMEGEHWDGAFIAYYPNAGCFLEMVTDPVYQQAVKHRQAAILTSRLVRFGEAETNEGAFG